MFRLADRLDRVVDEAGGVGAILNRATPRGGAGSASRGNRRCAANTALDRERPSARRPSKPSRAVDSGVNALRASPTAAVESVRVETLTRLERMEANRWSEARRGDAVGARSLVGPSVESRGRVAAGFEQRRAPPPCGPRARTGASFADCGEMVTATPLRVACGIRSRRRRLRGANRGPSGFTNSSKNLCSKASPGTTTRRADTSVLGAVALVVLAAEASPRPLACAAGACRVATRVVRAAVWTSSAALLSGVVFCHRVALLAICSKADADGGVRRRARTSMTMTMRTVETPPARSSADPELFVNTH